MTKSMESVSAIVEHDYTAKESNELNLTKGAIIQNVKPQSSGWWEGQLAGKTGLFRDTFVRFLGPDDPNSVVLRDPSQTVNRRCKVVYSYKQNNNDELTLAVGEVIEVIDEVEEGWWRGKLRNQVGVFPSNFVVLLEPSPLSAHRLSQNNRSHGLSGSREDMVSTNNNLNHQQQQHNVIDKDAPTLPPKPVREYCKVLYPYEPANADELELLEGDVITIISKELPDKGWWKGELRGKVGVFPDNFITLLPPDVVPVQKDPKLDRSSPLSKVISKSPIGSMNNVSGGGGGNIRKDSFGSRDSLNDSVIKTGSVAAHRKSLESKSVDPVVATSANDKPPRKSFGSGTAADIRKSLESLDEKKGGTPPPVLSKKPTVPVKKSPIAGVTSNLLSGLKSKVTKNESKNNVSDSLDGIGASKMQVADSGDKSVHGERIVVGRNESDFDHVERNTGVLKDMRANRAKLPKGRRLPSQGANSSSSDLPSLLNGSSGSMDESLSSMPIQAASMPPTTALGHSSQSEDELVKPKPREWEKNRAPWMAELKASQQLKKTSPNSLDSMSKSPESKKEEHHSAFSSILTSSTSSSSNQQESNTVHHEQKYDMSKSFSSSFVSSSATTTSSTKKVLDSVETRSHSVDVKNEHPKEVDLMSKSTVLRGATEDESLSNKIRPTSVNLRNRSISPIGGRQLANTRPQTNDTSSSITAATANTTTIHHQEIHSNGNIPKLSSSSSSKDDNNRLVDLEQRMTQLERTVQGQALQIDVLMRLLREETDKVKTLKSELEKYASCVTQV